jgi:hypothetical protein
MRAVSRGAGRAVLERAHAGVERDRFALVGAEMHAAREIRHAAAAWHTNSISRCMKLIMDGAPGARWSAMRTNERPDGGSIFSIRNSCFESAVPSSRAQRRCSAEVPCMCTGRLCRNSCLESVREVAPSAYLRTSRLTRGGAGTADFGGAGGPVRRRRAALGQCACGRVMYCSGNVLGPSGGSARGAGARRRAASAAIGGCRRGARQGLRWSGDLVPCT